ncbi:MAG: transcriptional regulator [Ignavibacteria bacterium]|nr:transcriptional regulator [Ignavibacteria bacterium]
MGVVERREREKEQRRQQIMDAGEKVFLAHGINMTTMEQISNECEISRGTIYLYFKNKEEIFQTIVIKALDILYSIMYAKAHECSDSESKLRAIGEAYLEFHAQYPSYFKLINLMDNHKNFDFESGGLILQLLEKSNKVWGLIVEVITSGIEAGEFTKDIKPFDFAILIWASSSGVINVIDHFKSSHINCNNDMEVESPEYCNHLNIVNLDLEELFTNLMEAHINSIKIHK